MTARGLCGDSRIVKELIASRGTRVSALRFLNYQSNLTTCAADFYDYFWPPRVRWDALIVRELLVAEATQAEVKNLLDKADEICIIELIQVTQKDSRFSVASLVMQIHITTADGVPIYQQIVNQVKYLVASGRLSPGDEMPPIRVLAERLIVNPNTVARAYRELEAAGMRDIHPRAVGASLGSAATTVVVMTRAGH